MPLHEQHGYYILLQMEVNLKAYIFYSRILIPTNWNC